MKIVLCCVLIASCIYVGFVLSSDIKKKKLFWGDMVKFCEFLSVNIGFGQKKLKEILLSYQDMCCEELKVMLKNYLINSSFLLESSENNSLFNKEEQNLLEEFFNSLGEFDVFNELIKVENYKTRFLKKYEIYCEKSFKFSPLILKLALIFGIMLCIVFI